MLNHLSLIVAVVRSFQHRRTLKRDTSVIKSYFASQSVLKKGKKKAEVQLGGFTTYSKSCAQNKYVHLTLTY